MLNFTSYTADSHLTFSSPSTAGDSFCKTAMSRREDIVSCIDDEDRTVGLDQAGARFVQESFSQVGARGVNRITRTQLEHFDRQFVAVVEYCIDFARQAAKPRRVLVLHSRGQDPNRGRPRAGHPYSKQSLEASVFLGNR
jgi:hypothetical protein